MNTIVVYYNDGNYILGFLLGHPIICDMLSSFDSGIISCHFHHHR